MHPCASIREDVVPKRELSYIVGNPPFYGVNPFKLWSRKKI
jgi:hypothetical protein